MAISPVWMDIISTVLTSIPRVSMKSGCVMGKLTAVMVVMNITVSTVTPHVLFLSTEFTTENLIMRYAFHVITFLRLDSVKCKFF